MQASALPTPPLSDSGEMDRGQRLPPISTLAGFVRENAASNTSPASQQQGEAVDTSLKRKRSHSPPFANDYDQREGKRQSTGLNTGRPSTTGPFGRDNGQRSSGKSTSLPSISPAFQLSTHPAVGHDRTAPTDYSPRYTNRPSPQSSSSISDRRAGRDSSFAPTSAYNDNTGATLVSPIDPNLSQNPSNHQQLPAIHRQQQQPQNQQTPRSLPPLVHPETSRPAAERAVDVHSSRPSLPAFGSLSEYQATASRHQYSSYPSTNAYQTFSPREAPVESQRSSYAYPSPQRAQHHQTLQPPFTYDPAPGSSYSFDHRTAHHEERRALPPMPNFSDPLPPSQPPVASHSTLPPNSLERYRFDATLANDHPARRRRGNLPKEATARLNEWFAQHANYPYPKEEEKQRLQEQTGLSMSQIGNWFINARRRRKPATVPRPLDTTLPPPPNRHAYAAQTTPHITSTLPPPPPPPQANHDRTSYPYPQLPPPYP